MTCFQLLQLSASFFGPIVAASLVMIGWRRTHRDASERDLDNWRRNALLALASRMLDLSTTRDNILLHTWNSYASDGASAYTDWKGTKTAVVAMPAIAAQAHLLGAKQLAMAMDDIVKLHNASDSTLSDAHLTEADIASDLQNIMIDDESLKIAHHNLQKAFDDELARKRR